jgi:hypothetical protein
MKEDNDHRDLGSGALGSSSWAGRHRLLIVLRGDLGVGGGGVTCALGTSAMTCAWGDLHLCVRGGGDNDLRVGGHLHLCVWGGSNDLHVGGGGDDLCVGDDGNCTLWRP